VTARPRNVKGGKGGGEEDGLHAIHQLPGTDHLSPPPYTSNHILLEYDDENRYKSTSFSLTLRHQVVHPNNGGLQESHTKGVIPGSLSQ
jgi:hypothetical protein